MARILYVDCCPERVEQVCSMLEELGHVVHCVNCAERAMLQVQSEEGYEAVVMHLFLPGMDGAELSRWMAEWHLPDGITEVAFTCRGEHSPVDLSRGLPRWLPVDRFIEGLEAPEELVAAVRELLDEQE